MFVLMHGEGSVPARQIDLLKTSRCIADCSQRLSPKAGMVLRNLNTSNWAQNLQTRLVEGKTALSHTPSPSACDRPNLGLHPLSRQRGRQEINVDKQRRCSMSSESSVCYWVAGLCQ